MILKTWKTAFFVWLLIQSTISYAADKPKDTTKDSTKDSTKREILSSLTFTSGNVLQARESVKRVGWTENVIDSHYPSGLPELKQVWVSVVKAALFGGEERIQKAMNTWQIQVEKELKNTANPLPENFSLLLQSCDCLLALPEIFSSTQNYGDSIKKTNHLLLQRLLDIHPDQGGATSVGDLQWKPLQLYASLMPRSASETISSSSMEKMAQDLVGSVQSQVLGEGLIPGTVENQMQTAQNLLLAGTALQTVSPEAFVPLRPYIQKSIDFIAELVYPDGNTPASYGTPLPLESVEVLLERGYNLFKNPEYLAILNAVYRNTPRKGEALLYGVPVLDNKTTFAGRTSAFPQAGFAVLRNENQKLPLSVFIDTGLSHFGQDSALLGIEVKSGRNQITGIANEKGTGKFNTVLIDQASQTQPQPNQSANALIYSLRTLRDGCTYLTTMAEGQFTERKPYPASTYQRSLYLADTVLFDVFRVRGGKTHDYRYTFNGKVENASGFTPGSLKQSQPVKGIYGFLLKPNDTNDIGERLWFVDPAGSSLRVQENNNQSTVYSSRTAEGDEAYVFIAVHDYEINSSTSSTNVSRIAFQPSGNSRDFQISGVAAEHGKDADIFITSTNPDSEYTAEYLGKTIVFQGLWGHIALKDGKFKALRLGGGKKLRFGEFGVIPKESLINGLARTVIPSGTVELDFDRTLPEVAGCFGHSFLAVSNNPGPVMFQSFVINSISLFETPQKAIMQNHPSLVRVNPSIGFDLLPGTQLLYESCTELRQLDDKNFTLALNSTTDFMIEGTEDYADIHYREPGGRNKVIGEFKVGIIQAQLSPEDSREGFVKFERIGRERKHNK